MPLTVREGALLGSGMLCLSGAVFFYARKQTLPFKICHFLAWPTLGSGIILSCQPNYDGAVQRLESSGAIDDDRLAESRKLVQSQMQAIKEAAGKD
ncbi:hypothetical protein BSKO_01563 [Bryopsis sp. KO-2023]|nr:hypothetical protein BSKO_01563 [Bryopsis sp. KO-2023]